MQQKMIREANRGDPYRAALEANKQYKAFAKIPQALICASPRGSSSVPTSSNSAAKYLRSLASHPSNPVIKSAEIPIVIYYIFSNQYYDFCRNREERYQEDRYPLDD
jgi:hypothetical protein